MPTVWRSDVCAVLESWQAGAMKAPEVHAWAEERYSSSTWEAEDDVTNEVLARLDMLDMNLITADDVPAYLEALGAPPKGLEQAREILQQREQSVDFEARMESLREDPFYSRYCD